MNNCERFERLYIDWQEGRLDTGEADSLARHAGNCSDCASISVESMKLSQLLRNQPEYRPANGFEWRLMQSIKAVENNGKPIRVAVRKSPAPRLAALGAGLATGLAVGILVLTAPVGEQNNLVQNGITETPAPMLAESVPASENKLVDTLSSRRDSTKKDGSSYSISDYGKLVSDR